MILSRKLINLLLSLFVFSSVQAGVITEFDKDNVPILNEELRQIKKDSESYADSAISTVMSTDGTLADNADTVCPTEKAVVTYCSNLATIATGTYTGNGTEDKGIDGLGFQPKYVRIWAHLTNTSCYEKLDQTWGAQTFVPDVPVFNVNAGITSLDSDGFTVDDGGKDAHPNKNGQVYDYLAIGVK